MDSLADSGIFVSVVSYMEVLEGALRFGDRVESEAQVAIAIGDIPVLEVSPGVAKECAFVRSALRRAGRRVNPRALDLLIAATAIAHDLTLVTRNVRDYRDVTGLQLFEA